MDINRFTEKAQEAVRSAQTLATRYSNQQIEVEHLMLALLEQQGGLVPSVLERAGVNVEPLKQAIEREVDRMPKVTGPSGPVDQVYITARLNKTFVAAEDEAKKLTDEYISVEHLLLAIIDENGPASRILKTAGATRDRIEKALKEVRGNQRITSQNPEATYEALERYGRDLTKGSVADQLKSVGIDGKSRQIEFAQVGQLHRRIFGIKLLASRLGWEAGQVAEDAQITHEPLAIRDFHHAAALAARPAFA